jgi:multisubunit Na+/H+ antiporter MnhC subunit
VTGQTEEKPQLRPWQWPGEWLRDEKFWKDVATRTVSGALVVFIVFLVGVSNGLLKVPTVMNIVIGLFLIAGGVGLYLGFVWKYQKWIAPLNDKIEHPWNEFVDILIKIFVLSTCMAMIALGIASFYNGS